MIDTPPAIAALLTPRGRGAVATIAYRGEASLIDAARLFRAANHRSVNEQSLGRAVFGRWGDEPVEEVVLCRIAGDRVEIHCHGGDAAAARILSHLERMGASCVDWRDFVERTESRFAADVAEALATAATSRTAAIIANLADGPLRAGFESLAGADPVRDRHRILDRLDALLGWAEFGLHLTRPWRVVLYGRPNVGKSSLINALVGFQRAIVFDRPGTTRDVVTAETAFEGWPVSLSDTAGLRSDADELETAGIERAQAALAAADLRVLVIDRSVPPPPNSFLSEIEPRPRLVVLNKSDLTDAWGEHAIPDSAIAVSAKTGERVRELMARLTAELVPRIPANEDSVPITPRQVAAMRAARMAVETGDSAAFRQAMNVVIP